MGSPDFFLYAKHLSVSLEIPLKDFRGQGSPYSLVPRPFLHGWGERGEGRKGLVNNSTLTRIHGCIPAVSVDEGKHECQVGVSRE